MEESLKILLHLTLPTSVKLGPDFASLKLGFTLKSLNEKSLES